MKGKPLGEAEKAQNTKNACHVETRRQDCERSGSRAKFSLCAGFDVWCNTQYSSIRREWRCDFIVCYSYKISQNYAGLNVQPQG
ncbi:MAG: hypothetical protein ACP5R6_07410 [Chlorobaculum sp.]